MLDPDMILMRQTLNNMLDKIIAPVAKTYFDKNINDFITIHDEIDDDDFIGIANYLYEWLLLCLPEHREDAYKLIVSIINTKLRLTNLANLTEKIEWVKRTVDTGKALTMAPHLRNALKTSLDDTEQETDTQIDKKLTYLQYALFHYYLQRAGISPYFENFPCGKVKAIEDTIRISGLKSAKRFQQDYNSISTNLSERQHLCKKRDYETLMIILEIHPTALEIATKELKKADW